MLDNKMEKIKLEGRVIKEKFAPGSKSEHDAIFLDTGKEKYRLQRKGGNPFYDDSLHKMVGKNIIAEGNITPYCFQMTGEPEELT